MKFLTHKRRSAPAVIIVALIDVLIVLVIFLLVTTTFKQQPALRLALPESSQAQKSGANEKEKLVVSIDAAGHYRYGKDNLPKALYQLRNELLARAAEDPNVKLAIEADKNAPWESIVNVMDFAKEAKIKNLSAITKNAGKP